MPAPLNVFKVVVGAFAVPWWNRRAFIRALAVPLVAIVALSLAWQIMPWPPSTLVFWLIKAFHLALFTLFAVTCHRLVLLDARSVSTAVLPSWTWRETRFAALFLASGLVSMVIIGVIATSILNLWIVALGEPESPESKWAGVAMQLAVSWLFARFCLVFPATAIDRKVGLRWSWRLTRGNGLRLFAVVSLLPWGISYLLRLIYRSDASTVEIVLLTLLAAVFLVFEIAALSLSYRELTSEEVSA